MTITFKFSGLARFLCALLALAITLDISCAALPAPKYDNNERSQLTARGNSLTIPAENSVRMGETEYFDFTTAGEAYGSKGFDGCVGVLIAGRQGAIIGHYACNPQAIAGEMNGIDNKIITTDDPKAAIQAIPNEWTLHAAALRQGLETHVYAPAAPAKPEMVKRLIQIVTDVTGRAPVVHRYSESTAGEKKAGFGVKFISRAKGFKTEFAS